MSTRSSSSSNLVPPFFDPESVIRNRRRNLGDPYLLLDFEEINMANNNNNVQGPPPAGPNFPAPDLRSMEELLQAPTDGVGDAIIIPPNLANQFELKIGLLNLVTAIAFHGFENDDPYSHILRFTKITQTVKLNNVPSDVVKLLLFPFSLEGATRTWLEKEPPNSITTWNDLVSNFSPLHQIDTFYNSLNQSDHDSLNSTAGVSSASGSSTQDAAITALTKQVEALVSSMNQPINSIQNGCETCGGPHAYYECQAAGGYTQKDVYATTGTYNAGGNSYQPQGSRKSICLKPNDENKKGSPGDTSGSFDLPSPVSSPSEPPKRNPHQPPIPYPSRLNKEKLQDKSDIQVHKFFQMFKKFHFNISLVEALALMPKYHKMLKDLLSDKEKLLGLVNTSLIENCSAVLLKKLLEKLGDPGKFLIPCDFPKLKKCMALADLGANINLMPLSVRKKLMLPKLVPTRMTLELANRSIAYPAGIAEDVFVQVGKFTFPADFVVVNYNVDPRVPIILGRPFLRTACALVDHGNESINMINFIDITCEDHFDEVLKIQKSIHYLSGSPTPSDLVVDSLVEETDILLSHFNDSSPDYEIFCFDIEEKSSGSTTSHSYHSLLEYESFCFDVDHTCCLSMSHATPF
ncbi:reverse transcriptase domain-containing protein [Tanacetum coccineum]